MKEKISTTVSVSVQQPHIRDSREGEKRSLLEVNEHFRPTDNKVDGADERLPVSFDEYPFIQRHIGPSEEDVNAMLSLLGFKTLDEFIAKVVPAKISTTSSISVESEIKNKDEHSLLQYIQQIVDQNKVWRSYIGQGYYGTIMPQVIKRNILENPGWYTQYTPYQPEISQGRLEALLNFQTVITELTELPIANASLLDEGTAAAEALTLARAVSVNTEAQNFFVADDVFQSTIDVVRSRGEILGIKIIVGNAETFKPTKEYFGMLVQYPNNQGKVTDYSDVLLQAKAEGIVTAVATDLMALTLVKTPGSMGAEIALGNAQRFGIPFGFGGPHAAFFVTVDAYKRHIPGRIVGVSKDTHGNPALRLSLQTREQHIRREKATSNICTAQVLLAILSGMYAVYHGPGGLQKIARGIHQKTTQLYNAIIACLKNSSGIKPLHSVFFDTLTFQCTVERSEEIKKRAAEKEINLNYFLKNGCPDTDQLIAVSLDETVQQEDLLDILYVFTGEIITGEVLFEKYNTMSPLSENILRTSEYLRQKVFTSFYSETEFLRYVKRLESRDLSLAHSMIPLGSCTMKLNATTEMVPVTWEKISNIHPFVPFNQVSGYLRMFSDLEKFLCSMTGFSAVSLQPNSGAQGEYAGLLAIRAYQKSKGEAYRNVCFIPKSAHGTNPASAVMADLEVVPIECDDQGNISMDDVKEKLTTYGEKLSVMMITYPSTHGVFEEGVLEISSLVHKAGGQVYMDGANLNALVGIAKPQEIGMDVCHINLHKTFCIPHGGGGPGMGPIAVAKHIAPFLPTHFVFSEHSCKGIQYFEGKQFDTHCGSVCSAPWGSSSILPISWAYMMLMGSSGLTYASKISILNANYTAKKLQHEYPVVFKGESGFVAHECIIDLRSFKKSCGIEVDDVAKRLMDYSFHAPTVSWPVASTMMIEPTESESKAELDRFCDALLSIREEIREIESGKADKAKNILKGAPHTAYTVVSESWDKPYSRERAAFPNEAVKEKKFWPYVGRIDAGYGDRNLICSCDGFFPGSPVKSS
jgi:glycine dehydrogenase